MWKSPRPLTVNTRSRPVRVAFLIPREPSHELLDAVFFECTGRWGGRRTPIIPTDGQTLTENDYALLDYWDADFLYSYVDLDPSLARDLFERLAPGEIKRHDSDDFAPDYRSNLAFLSSFSVVPYFSRNAQLHGQAVPLVAAIDPGIVPGADFADCFGLQDDRIENHKLTPFAQQYRLCARIDLERAVKGRSAADPLQHDNASVWCNEVAESPNILTPALLSDTFVPCLRELAEKDGWNDHLSVVIGDSAADRLLFWNAHFKYPAMLPRIHLPVLRLSPRNLENGLPPWVETWLKRRHTRHYRDNHAPRVQLRSCSLSAGELEERKAMFKVTPHLQVSAAHHESASIFDQLTQETRVKQRRVYWGPSSDWTQPPIEDEHSFRFRDDQYELPSYPPWHTQDVERTGLTHGVWAVDMRIERSSNHTMYDNRPHTWAFPRRLRLDQAVNIEGYGGDLFTTPGRLRPTRAGDLSLWDGPSWHRPQMEMPGDFEAFVRALIDVPFETPALSDREGGIRATQRLVRCGTSDKGRDLLGVLQIFRSFREAISFLMSRFWRDVIAQLSPARVSDRTSAIDTVAKAIRQGVESPVGGVTDYSLLAKRALTIAARSLDSPKEMLQWRDFAQLRDLALRMSGGKKSNDPEERLQSTVEYLRDQGFLWQGQGWRCPYCQHRNWRSLDRLAARLACEVCRYEVSSDVSGTPQFRLNPLVQHAFSETSRQDTVIWCLERLSEHTSRSLAFVQSLKVQAVGAQHPMEIDLLAAVDGEIYLVEVKASFKGIDERAFEQVKQWATLFRPNVILFAVMAPKAEADDLNDRLQSLRQELRELHVRLELWTLEDTGSSSPELLPLPAATDSRWSAKNISH